MKMKLVIWILILFLLAAFAAAVQTMRVNNAHNRIGILEDKVKRLSR